MFCCRYILILLTLTFSSLMGQILDKVQPGETELLTPAKYTEDIVNPSEAILNRQIPVELTFNNEKGETVALGSILTNGKPTLLCMMYMGCKTTCGPLMNDVYTKINDLNLKPGSDYNLLFVSMDHSETADLAAGKKQSFLDAYKYQDGNGHNYLTGTKDSIHSLTNALDFKFRAIEEVGDFTHPTVVYFITPQAKISRFFTGFEFNAQDVRLSLLNAGEGKIGTVIDNILIRCYKFDSQNKKYIYNSMMLMSVSGAVTLFAVALFLGFLWYQEKKSSKTNIVNQK